MCSWMKLAVVSVSLTLEVFETLITSFLDTFMEFHVVIHYVCSKEFVVAPFTFVRPHSDMLSLMPSAIKFFSERYVAFGKSTDELSLLDANIVCAWFLHAANESSTELKYFSPHLSLDKYYCQTYVTIRFNISIYLLNPSKSNWNSNIYHRKI